ncbi:MAG TPA: HU family DNA-binding protein [Candidatus Polarisedimenticolia bacterium]|nr:HU family DNA-binding protein [Candidatus Polarisedimenticolia bacterium]
MAKSKADLADAVYRMHGGLSRREAEAVVDRIFKGIRAALARGRPVLISGFGSFKVKARRARVGRNPRTGEAVPIPGGRRAVFRASRLVVRGLNPVAGRKGPRDV